MHSCRESNAVRLRAILRLMIKRRHVLIPMDNSCYNLTGKLSHPCGLTATKQRPAVLHERYIPQTSRYLNHSLRSNGLHVPHNLRRLCVPVQLIQRYRLSSDFFDQSRVFHHLERVPISPPPEHLFVLAFVDDLVKIVGDNFQSDLWSTACTTAIHHSTIDLRQLSLWNTRRRIHDGQVRGAAQASRDT
jgi:hypothetical protein